MKQTVRPPSKPDRSTRAPPALSDNPALHRPNDWIKECAMRAVTLYSFSQIFYIKFVRQSSSNILLIKAWARASSAKIKCFAKILLSRESIRLQVRHKRIKIAFYRRGGPFIKKKGHLEIDKCYALHNCPWGQWMWPRAMIGHENNISKNGNDKH